MSAKQGSGVDNLKMAISLKCPTCQTSFEIEESRLRASYGWASCPACSKVFIGVQNMMYKGEIADFRITDRADFERNNPRNMPAQTKKQPPPKTPESPSETATTSTQKTPSHLLKPINTPATHQPNVTSATNVTRATPVQAQQQSHKEPGAATKSTETLTPAFTAAAVSEEPILAAVPTIPGLLEVDDVLRQAVETGVFPGEKPVPPPFALEDEPVGPPAKKGRKRMWFLLVLALTSYTYFDRARIAAFAPVLRPSLQQACSFLSCTVPPLYDLSQVTKEGDSFIRLAGDNAGGGNAYRLEMRYQNHSEWFHYAVPLMDLEVSDIEGNIVLRREIDPIQIDSQAQAVAPKSDWSGKLDVTINLSPELSQSVAGYALRPKYPLNHAADNPISSFLEQLFETRP